MGRPPIGKIAMSAAERQRRRRDRLRDVTKPRVTKGFVQEQAAEITRLRAELARLSPVSSAVRTDGRKPNKPAKPKMPQAERNARAAAGRAASKARRAAAAERDKRTAAEAKATSRKIAELEKKTVSRGATAPEAEAAAAKAKQLEEKQQRKHAEPRNPSVPPLPDTAEGWLRMRKGKR